MFNNLYILFCTAGAFSYVSAVHNETNVPPYHQEGKLFNCDDKYLMTFIFLSSYNMTFMV